MSPPFHKSSEEYKQAIKDLFDLFDERSEIGPVILCGDSNTDIKTNTAV